MATQVEDAHNERRAVPPVIGHGGRRWREDPDIAAAVERLLLDLSRDVHAMRDGQGWSQEEAATAAGVHPDTLLNLEKMRDDVHLSTVVRVAHIFGFEPVIRFRRSRRLPGLNLGNPVQPAQI